MNQTTRKIIGYIVAAILVVIGIDMFFDAYRFATGDTQPEAVEAIDRSDWITYTNTNYGYEISYPSTVEFTKSSETVLAPNEIPGRKDQLVFLGDSFENSVYNISAGAALKDYTATSSELLLKHFKETTMPSQIRGRLGEKYSLSTSDYKFKEILHNDSPTIEVQTPAGYRIEKANSNGDIFIVTASDYSGETTTPKDRLTREIIDTFRVIEPTDD